MAAPKIPIIIPSIMNGIRINASVAPTNFIMAISSLRTLIPIVIVVLIRNMDTASSIMIIAAEI